MNKIWPYISAFLLGGLLVAILALKIVKPSIVTDSYFERFDQSVKKLKQSGTNNTQDITNTVDVSSDKPKNKKKFLGIFNRRKA